MPTLKMETHVVTRLIDLLADDDVFRERFTNDTAAALHEIGHIGDVAELDHFIKSCLAESFSLTSQQ